MENLCLTCSKALLSQERRLLAAGGVSSPAAQINQPFSDALLS